MKKSTHNRNLDFIEVNQTSRNNQQPLARSNDGYALPQDSLSAGYIVITRDGVIQCSTDKAAEFLSCGKLDLVNRKMSEFIHDEAIDKFYLYLNALIKYPKDSRVELRLTMTGNIVLSVVIQAYNKIASGSGPLYLLTINDSKRCLLPETATQEQNLKLEEKVDTQTAELLKINRQLHKKITELAESKQEIMDQEAKLNSIFNAAVEGIITINESGLIESVNAAVTAIFGYKKEELIGRNISILMTSKQGSEHDKYISEYIKNHKSHALGSIRELHGKRKDGSLIAIDLSLAEFEIDHKHYFTGILRDATDRKYKEQQDKEHLAELAHVTRLGLMGEMASGIAHEVTQPLTAIANYTQACLNFIQSPQFDRVKITEILHKTNAQAIKAGQIIHRMRDFVRSRKIHLSTVNINDLVKTTLALCQTECVQLQITLKTELLGSLPNVFVDFVQIEQVLLNLIRNSIEALQSMPKDYQKRMMVQTYLNEKNQVEVRVKDNGPGLDEQQKREIFTPFYTTKNKGMGMGLAISRSIIEAHNGILRFNSQKNKGTTFYFAVPVA